MNNKLFIKIYYNVNGQDIRETTENARYLIGGGFYNKEGGHFTFKARSLKEARDIANDISYKNVFRNLNFLLLPDNINVQ
ncbi:hypothetical protein CLLI_17820 [Clostridium liquoris]|jgi:hypothetical protein|uniref:Uncharacterized protein n=1 Tax=Clostridium liquoris TaxID=1289519 RepID=A0A2T0B398_9CLOT|nr:hypothetical protein [Clostridium liquoris]PRR78355.1 hypothetical protein CLLI_17820 [Clostridium liquoris]